MFRELYPTGLLAKYYSQDLWVDVHWSCCSPNPKPPIHSSVQFLQGWFHKKSCSAKFCNMFIIRLLDSWKHLKTELVKELVAANNKNWRLTWTLCEQGSRAQVPDFLQDKGLSNSCKLNIRHQY